MPTGYTCDIKDGISFKEYAMKCARAFGACISMRDEPQNKEIPEKFEASTYHIERIEEIQIEINELTKLTEEDIKKICLDEYNEEKERIEKNKKENHQLLEKYKKMLNEAKQYIPPSDDHIKFKNFMISQIEESIGFDCNTDYYDNKKAVLRDYKTYVKDKLKNMYKDISYHAEEHLKEIKRTEERNIWVSQLRKSLDKY